MKQRQAKPQRNKQTQAPAQSAQRSRPTRQPPAEAGERVQKILARAGLASRREAEEWVRAGRVTVNGEPATLGTRARGSDQLRLDGRLIHQAPASRSATWLCHRSPGEDLLPPRTGREASAAEATEVPAADSSRGALSQRLSRRVGRRYISVSPMPRSDGGLELLTSDGALAARLQRAVRGLQIEFSVRIRGELDAAQLAAVLQGHLADGTVLQVLECEPGGGEGQNHWYRVLTQGANGRELRVLLEQQRAMVSRMLRVSLGGLKLERTLARGHARQLTESEIDALLDGGMNDRPGIAGAHSH